MKKGTALVKRVTSLTEETLPSIISDISTFNLTRYSSEVGAGSERIESAMCRAHIFHCAACAMTLLLQSSTLS